MYLRVVKKSSEIVCGLNCSAAHDGDVRTFVYSWMIIIIRIIYFVVAVNNLIMCFWLMLYIFIQCLGFTMVCFCTACATHIHQLKWLCHYYLTFRLIFHFLYYNLDLLFHSVSIILQTILQIKCERREETFSSSHFNCKHPVVHTHYLQWITIQSVSIVDIGWKMKKKELGNIQWDPKIEFNSKTVER